MNPLTFPTPQAQAASAAAMVRDLQALPGLQLLLDAERQKKQARLDVLRAELSRILSEADSASANSQAAIVTAEARLAEAQKEVVAAAGEVEVLKSRANSVRAGILEPKARVQSELRALEAALAPPSVEPVDLPYAAKPEFPPMIDDRFRPQPRW